MTGYFYRGQRLATTVNANKASSVFAGADVVLGEISGKAHLLLAVDRTNSILKVRDNRCYSPYGFDEVACRDSLLGYNGEHRDVTSKCDLLGNGVRTYNPVLMRFCSPDVISPFSFGGINAYAYCSGDPVNYRDPSGRMKRSSSTLTPGSIKRPRVVVSDKVLSGERKSNASTELGSSPASKRLETSMSTVQPLPDNGNTRVMSPEVSGLVDFLWSESGRLVQQYKQNVRPRSNGNILSEREKMGAMAMDLAIKKGSTRTYSDVAEGFASEANLDKKVRSMRNYVGKVREQESKLITDQILREVGIE